MFHPWKKAKIPVPGPNSPQSHRGSEVIDFFFPTFLNLSFSAAAALPYLRAHRADRVEFCDLALYKLVRWLVFQPCIVFFLLLFLFFIWFCTLGHRFRVVDRAVKEKKKRKASQKGEEREKQKKNTQKIEFLV